MASPLISVRVVNVDWYLSEESKLPVVRIFGSTPAGQRACLHLHGALPYFMVRPMEDDNPAISAHFEDPESLRTLLLELEMSIEAAMAISAGKPFEPTTMSQSHEKAEASASRQRVQQRALARLEVVRGVPFYGYNGDEVLFVKVYVNNPALTGKVASILQAGHVMSTRFQPYESHVPFLLQVFIDYNISGMSYVHLKNAIFLHPLPERSSVPLSQLPDQGRKSADDSAAMPGIFVASSVPKSLIAHPPSGAVADVNCPGNTVVNERAVELSGSSETTELRGSVQEPMTLKVTSQIDEVAQDLLAGISMSQLFSQPLPSPEPLRFRQFGMPSPNAKSPPKLTNDPDAQKRPPAKWWERQSTTELELTGAVCDVINPNLLAAGKAEAGGKAVAVASLRELWDEERERARAAGGGSQLSAPPGLELANSQDKWAPLDSLLTQDLIGTVHNLARNVLGRAPPMPEGSAFPSTSRSQSDGQDHSMSRPSYLNLSGEGLSQGSTGVASVSDSVALHLSAPDAGEAGEGDRGLLDMLAALRGSQSQPESRCSPMPSPRAGLMQSQDVPNSQALASIPTPLVDQADAILKTQRKRELDEEELDLHRAIAADCELQYESDGSNEGKVVQGARTVPVRSLDSPVAALPDKLLVTPTPAAWTQNADLPPWSQRAASYPPWSARSAPPSALRSATCPGSSQRGATEASQRFLGKMIDRRSSCPNSEQREEDVHEQEREDEKRDVPLDETILSQLSSRSLDELENSVRVELEAQARSSKKRSSSTYETPSKAQTAGPDSSELVGIICSQVEFERDHTREFNYEVDDANGDELMDVPCRKSPENDEDGGDKEMFECEEEDPQGRENDRQRVREPIQLEYDESSNENGSLVEEDLVVIAGDTDQEEDGNGVQDECAPDGSPLRLRGGVGPRTTQEINAAAARSHSTSSLLDSSDDGNAPAQAQQGSRQILEAREVLRTTSGSRSLKHPRNATWVGERAAVSMESTGTDSVRRRINSPEKRGADSEDEKTAVESVERSSQVVIPGWVSQGHHNVEYSGSKLNFVSTSQLHTSPSLARGRRTFAGSEAESEAGIPRKKKRLLDDEGRSDGMKDVTSGASGCSRSAAPAASDVNLQEITFDAGRQLGSHVPAVKEHGKLNVQSSTGATRETLFTDSRAGQEEPKAMVENTDETKKYVKSRWASADERLRLARARGARLPLAHQSRNNRGKGKSREILRLPSQGESNVGPAAPLRIATPELKPWTATDDPNRVPSAISVAYGHAQMTDRGSHPAPDQRQEAIIRSITNESTCSSLTVIDSPKATAGHAPPLGECTRPDSFTAGEREESDERASGASRGDINQRDFDRLNVDSIESSSEDKGIPAFGANQLAPDSSIYSSSSSGERAARMFQDQDRDISRASPDRSGIGDEPSENSSTSISLDPGIACALSQSSKERGFRHEGFDSCQKAAGAHELSQKSRAAASPLSSVPSMTPPSPVGFDSGRSPAPFLSAHSDQSETMVPLGQRTPASRLRRIASSSKRSNSKTLEDRVRSNEEGGRDGGVSFASPGMPLTAGSVSMKSPAQESFPGSTPLASRRQVVARGSGVVMLRPRESAPDPAESAAALTRLGLPQVVHTEPFYSRRDDVPERPREFGGKVFRIPHKDDLEVFDTTSSRELLYAHRQRLRMTPKQHRTMGEIRICAESAHASSSSQGTPGSQGPHAAASWRGKASVDGGSSTSRAHSPPRGGGIVGARSSDGSEARETSGAPDNSSVIVLSTDAAEQCRRLLPFCRMGEADLVEALRDGSAVLSSRSWRRPRVLKLVPSVSAPSYKAVATWARAHPPKHDGRQRRLIDPLDMPTLRSTRNALGVLAGGGEADLVDDAAEISMVADANTGQLVPLPVARPSVPPSEPLAPGMLAQTPPTMGLPSSSPETVASVFSSGAATARKSDEVNLTASVRRAKRPTQAPHRPSTKSQISPTTQTPGSCLSEDAGVFAFRLGNKRAAAARVPAGGEDGTDPGPGDEETPAAAGAANASLSLGLSGGFVARDDAQACAGDRLTVLSLEIHVQLGSDRRPDPRRDPVHGICWRVKDAFTSAEHEVVETTNGVIVLPVPLRGAQVVPSAVEQMNNPTGTEIRTGTGAEVSGNKRVAERSPTCMKCGSRRDDSNSGDFCTFEGGGFLGQDLGGGKRRSREPETLRRTAGVDAAQKDAVGRPGRATFRHGLGSGVEVLEVCSEAQLFQALVAVFCRHDPDFVVGWEVQGDSLGYIIERGILMDPSIDMTRLLSRTPGREADRRNTGDEWGKTHGSGIWLTGRTVLNMWRLMRSELKLCSYTLQSVAEHVLRKRIPSFSLHLRSKWFAGRNLAGRSRALAEPLHRAAACLAIMGKLDLMGRTAEMARLFGIDFFSVLSRGSQYRVEAVMLRVLKPQNYVAVSPSRQQVASQAAMESIPLVFEPHSRFYTSPVVVLDFQSLYPSMMIAYNLCYSTCLGKFDPKTGGTSGRLGALSYSEAKTSAALLRAADAHDAWQGSQAQDRHRNDEVGEITDVNSGGGTQGITQAGGDVESSSKLCSGKGASEASSGKRVILQPSLENKGQEGAATGKTALSDGGDAKEALGLGERHNLKSQQHLAGRDDTARDGEAGAQGEGKTKWDPRCIHVAPNMAGFCHPSLRQGILPVMLREILETRVMIKGAMKRAEQGGQRVLARTLNARQFALKMISNVTYGYTAAGYSGRMPMAELADAIVESARQSLIAAARMVDNHESWNASVVYGDTDSLFIELPGRSLEEAHRIGREIAAAVSKSCPPDVVLKFEKVYLPCILASKKRYVGFMYESPKDLKPSFDAKGIETVRRDGCPLVVKMLEKVLRILFTTRDLSQIKGYLYRQWTRILTDRAAVGDFIFAKEVKLGTYASDVYMPPSAIVASKAMAYDPRAEPKYCERIPYVVVAGPVGARLMDLVVSPQQFLAEDSGLRLNGKYYITKVINPALDRALALLGVDVAIWYNDMPRPAPRVITKSLRVQKKLKLSSRSSSGGGSGGGGGGNASGFGSEFWDHDRSGEGKGRRKGGSGSSGANASVITNFFISDRCSLCGDQCARSVCGNCAREPAARCAALSRLRESDLAAHQLLEICRQCTGHAPAELFGTESCGSLECPVFFERHRAVLKGREARELCDALGLLST